MGSGLVSSLAERRPVGNVAAAVGRRLVSSIEHRGHTTLPWAWRPWPPNPPVNRPSS
jgi:hypothetical protein